jgi:hypothetical protein
MLKTFGQTLISQVRRLQMCFMLLKHDLKKMGANEVSEGSITFGLQPDSEARVSRITHGSS